MWNPDSAIDHEVPCASVGALRSEHPDGTESFHDSHARSPSCSGRVAAGEPHHCEEGWTAEGIDTRRYCRHCVREMNDRLDRERDKPLLVRVELTYSDGSKRWLEDDAADDWSRRVSAEGTVAFTHGYEGKPLPWKESM